MHRYMAVCVVFYASCYIYKEMKKMISNEMAVMIEGSSAIRAMFEEGYPEIGRASCRERV